MEKFCPFFGTGNLGAGHGADCPTKVECQDTMCSDVEIYFKLYEAEREADSTAVRYSSKDILEALRSEITGQTEKSKK